MRLWQILPLVPPGPGCSPYATLSAMAGNPWLIDLRLLAADGLLSDADLAPDDAFERDRYDAARVHAFKGPRLDAAADALLADTSSPLHAELLAFRAASPWAEDTARFIALKAARDERPWWEWEPALRDRDPAAVAAATDAVRQDVERGVAKQFFFDRQWRALRAYAAERGVSIIGDVPIYVDRDSVDVWANRDCFLLDAQGQPRAVAGVPPDFFSEVGQLWGNPLYDWAHLASTGHAWWVRRMQRATAQCDIVRLDHFRGFAGYWSVPADAEDARAGEWVTGPGRALFDDLRAALGELPLIAEDLGVMDDAVAELRDGIGVPGMRVLQFAFGEEASHPFLPHNHVENSVVYTATHDNTTTLGWWQSTSEHVRDHVRRYLAINGYDVVWDCIRAAFSSVARIAVVPLQDVLCLDAGARMNTPGTVAGNWAWRVRAEAFNAPLAARVREVVEIYGRA